jgi:8-oxo-dGTP pyrophosphatase MutT (NUDIX family)
MVDASGLRAVAIHRINRRGRGEWLLPKGHIEPGETPRVAAEREVLEETGIRGRAGASLRIIEYEFYSNRVRVRKFVRHFLLRMESGALSTLDHEVSDVAWFPLECLEEKLDHADERAIIRRAIELLRESSRMVLKLNLNDTSATDRSVRLANIVPSPGFGF